jgi:hypothetical protein
VGGFACSFSCSACWRSAFFVLGAFLVPPLADYWIFKRYFFLFFIVCGGSPLGFLKIAVPLRLYDGNGYG